MIKRLIHIIQSEKGLVLLDQAVFSGNSFIMTALLARFLGIETFGTISYLILGVYRVSCILWGARQKAYLV